MATLVILEHELQRDLGLPYMIYGLAQRWQANGHRVLVHHGTGTPPPGDLAVLNVDVTVVPSGYRRLLDRYRRVINGAVLDISKRVFSQDLLAHDSHFEGPVIVKTDANYGGRGEHMLHARGQHAGIASDIQVGPVISDYPVLESVRDVPETVWRTPGVIVEKFLPERDERGFYSRHWIFCGDRERSVRYRAAVPIIKSHHMLDREMVPVPEELRGWRKRLGFDFGKFDYVLHGGRWVLLDVNRTPSMPAQPGDDYARVLDSLAEGLESFLAGS